MMGKTYRHGSAFGPRLKKKKHKGSRKRSAAPKKPKNSSYNTGEPSNFERFDSKKGR